MGTGGKGGEGRVKRQREGRKERGTPPRAWLTSPCSKSWKIPCFTRSISTEAWSAWMSMWYHCLSDITFYDFCSFWSVQSVAVNITDKTRFLIFTFAALLPDLSTFSFYSSEKFILDSKSCISHILVVFSLCVLTAYRVWRTSVRHLGFLDLQIFNRC